MFTFILFLLILELDKCFDDVRNWMFLNKLEINDEKTEIM